MFSIPKAENLSQEQQSSKCVPVGPSALLVRFSDFLPHSGLALDLACGYGRNTLYLAREGLPAIGIDGSRKALLAGREAAIRSKLEACFLQADLTRFGLPANKFSVVICFKYRNREFYPSIRAALRPGGLLLYETYTCEHMLYGLKPRNPEHLLERGELYGAFSDWDIIFYREVWRGRGVASLVARKPLSAGEC